MIPVGPLQFRMFCHSVISYNEKWKEGKWMFKLFISICIVSSNLCLYFCGKWVTLLIPLRKQGPAALSWKWCPKLQALKSVMLTLCHITVPQTFFSLRKSVEAIPCPSFQQQLLISVPWLPCLSFWQQLLVDFLDLSFSVSSYFPWWVISNPQLFHNLVSLWPCSSGRVSLRCQHQGRKKKACLCCQDVTMV